MSEEGASWGLVGDSIKEGNTVENIERLFRAAKDGGFGFFISPHYLYPADQGWGYGGAVERIMLETKEFFRPDPLSLDGFTGSGADWLDRYKPFIQDGKTIVVSPHKVWEPQTNDLVLQLRKRRLQDLGAGRGDLSSLESRRAQRRRQRLCRLTSRCGGPRTAAALSVVSSPSRRCGSAELWR